MNYFRYLVCFTFVTISFSCKKPYNPPVVASNASYLVVEGVINAGSDSTIIKVSRTVNLLSKTTAAPLKGAILTVESDQSGVIFPLKETTGGKYVAVALNLDNARKYRLRIKTADGKQYVSDFVAVVNAPAIDSISYKTTTGGLNIYVNTHDPQNATRYYRWDYQETWIFHSNFSSYFKSNGTTILPRDMINDNIYQCWGTNLSSTIVLGSSAKLSRDIISDNLITSVASTSEKLSVKYSILVKQYALTKDAYTFWENLKKNTEQLGTIFDSQPSQTSSNIHSISDPLEPVVGYISVGSVTNQRIFITNQQLPAWVTARAYPDCKLDTFLYKYVAPGTKDTVNQVNLYLNYKNGAFSSFLPVNAISIPGRAVPLGYSGASPECVDCTLRGTNKQPAFWK
ncbi:MAG: hypothetical protein NVSMB24_10910 [Mucilaginibacter sp.]